MWNSWIVLAGCCLVITQSFPHPGYIVPKIPHGGRAQYYYLHDDGNYKYGYDTGAGQYENAVKMGTGVTGTFGFTNAVGENVKVDYTAGPEGFQPSLSSVPATASSVDNSQTYYAAPAAGSPSSTSGEILERNDASYNFNYEAGTHSRREQSDPDLNVAGSFSFIGDDGVSRRVNYVAGSDTGFVATGDHLPVAPTPKDTAADPPSVAPPSGHFRGAVPLLNSIDYVPEFTLNPDGSYSFKYAHPLGSRSETADSDLNVKGIYSFVGTDGVTRNVNYVAGSSTGFVVDGDSPSGAATPHSTGGIPATYSSPPASAGSVVPSSDADSSYSFSYRTSDSHRDEVADPDLNVKGSYGFTADDGKYRQVDYIAGSSTGFVAQGDHLPVAPEAAAPSIAAVPAVRDQPVFPLAPAPTNVYSAPQAQAGGEGSSSQQSDVDGSYSFSYKTDDSHREETADRDLNVKGSFGFKADDGVYRQVNYIAGSETGFVANGDHLPVAPEVPAVAPAPSSAPVRLYIAPETHSASSSAQSAAVDATADVDGAYSFSYKTSDSHREESADSDLNVQGSFGFTADDGKYRKVDYVAGSGTGFVARGDHLPVAPVAAAQPAPAPSSLYSSPVTSVASHADVNSETGPDGSYSFNYRTSDSHREETADSDLNIKGSFGFKADDGAYRQVNYIAGSSTGFLAEGDHLPTDPVDHPAPVFPVPAVVPQQSPAVYAAPAEESRSESDIDGSYSFNYQTDHSHREETADSDLNVKGSFGFKADDGVYRQVNYIAGSGTGFVAEGDHLPVAADAGAPVAPAAPAGVYSAPVAPAAPASLYAAPSPSESAAGAPTSANADSSYNFKYETDVSHREEVADSDLNVEGSFGFLAPDGVHRTVNYIAGSATGFVAEGAHLPVAPSSDAAVPVPATVYSPPTPITGPTPAPATTYFAPAPASAPVPAAPAGLYSVPDPAAPASLYSAPAPTPTPAHSSHPGRLEAVVGNVLLRQYITAPGAGNLGYVFTEQ